MTRKPPTVYGFFSDVHGDIEALQLALYSLKTANNLIFLGDMAGGRDSEICLNLLREKRIDAVIGNHDSWDFERITLSTVNVDYLNTWPIEIHEEDFIASHSLYEKKHKEIRFLYILDVNDARDTFDFFDKRIIFVGHTHTSQVFELTSVGTISAQPVSETSTINLNTSSRYIFNVGSASECTVEYRPGYQTVHYNFIRSMAKIRGAQLF